LHTHGKNYSSSSRAIYIRITSCDSQNIHSPPCESLKIFYFPKYRICGTTIHKAHFFFHWIDFKYLYRIINLFSTDYHTYSLYQSADILLQYISQSLNVTNIYYIDDRLIKIYKDKCSIILVSKHIVQVVLDDHVLSVDVVFDHQVWLSSFIRVLVRSCSLIGCIVEVSFI
jgi:hypothetical protein